MIGEFREFIARGNVIDLAVGIIIGSAFTAIVNSLVGDLINPVIGVVAGEADFSDYFVVLGPGAFPSLAAAREAGAPVLAYGAFLTAVIKFFIVAFAVFLVVRAVNRIKRLAERDAAAEATQEAPAGPTEKEILIQIRDALREGRAAEAPPG